MTTHKVAVIGGDGVGPEVTEQALGVLTATTEAFGFGVELTDFDLGGDRYLRTGDVLPDEDLVALADHDAILLGAVGTPEVPPGVLERGLLLRIRFEFDQYINLRPVKLYDGVPTPIAGLIPEQCDMIIIRENTEGMYVGAGGILRRGTAQETAVQESINTRFGAERALRFSFELARGRDGRLTLCHKTNVLNHAGDLWMRTAQEVAADFADVTLDYVHVDAACLYLVDSPDRFDVVVTDNLFGDIITDLGAAIQGGMGMAASGNIDPEKRRPSMFEPVHGSAPDIAGNGWANPVAAILSLAMCLDHLGEADAAQAVTSAAVSVLPELKTMGGPDMGMSTAQIGDLIASRVGG
ncbi:MAG: 3-isopropylmalate dehydrogenase [Acidimicrobiia bacterium]|nr:3-isopropylmalate dehydrogenase [Acidimicrobiia bacterium]